MARISAAIAARQSPPAPKGLTDPSMAEIDVCPPSARMTGTVPPGPVPRLFETATARMKFPAEWKGPFHRPRKQRFNDDVRLEAYMPDALSFADKQRRGIREAFDGCSSMKGHVKRAVKQPFPLASEIPIPKETMKAAQFVAENDPRLIAGFWDSQLASLENLVKSAASSQAKWNGFIDPAIRPAAGKIHILALRQLAEFCGLGASKWMGQFAAGFPITGDLSRDRAFPRKNPKEPLPPKKQLFATAEARFRERAPKSGWENAADLWTEAMGQHAKGWLASPVILAESGRPADLPSGGYNIAFRFGVEQAEKLRACDDLKHGLTNQACRVHTPIKLVSWVHLSHLCRTFAKDGGIGLYSKPTVKRLIISFHSIRVISSTQ